MAMALDLSGVEREALVELLTGTIEASRYPLSPRIKTLKAILAQVEPPVRQPEPFSPPKASGRPSAVLAKKRRR